MTHVRLTTEGAKKGAYKLEIDGTDVSQAVIAGSLRLWTPRNPDRPAEVTFTVAADHLEVDLPEAVLSAISRLDGSTS